MLNKDQIREKMTDHWIPEPCIHQLWRAIAKFGDDENATFDTMVGDAWLAPSRITWAVALLQHDCACFFDYLDVALEQRYGICTPNDVWDSASILSDAYEAWFMNQYRFLMDLQ